MDKDVHIGAMRLNIIKNVAIKYSAECRILLSISIFYDAEVKYLS